MKTIRTFAAVLLGALVSLHAAAEKGKPAQVVIDTQKSTVNWLAKKVTGEHNGTVNITKGALEVNGTKLIGGTFEIDMNSIKCLDLTDAGYNGRLVGHLKSDDFFNVAQFPTSTFKITKVTPIAGAKAGEANFTITGDLTIRGITNAVSFPSVVSIKGGGISATAKIMVDRSKYNVKFRSKSFFDAAELGDKLIYDEFEMNVNLVGSRPM